MNNATLIACGKFGILLKANIFRKRVLYKTRGIKWEKAKIFCSLLFLLETSVLFTHAFLC